MRNNEIFALCQHYWASTQLAVLGARPRLYVFILRPTRRRPVNCPKSLLSNLHFLVSQSKAYHFPKLDGRSGIGGSVTDRWHAWAVWRTPRSRMSGICLSSPLSSLMRHVWTIYGRFLTNWSNLSNSFPLNAHAPLRSLCHARGLSHLQQPGWSALTAQC
jgi:hypothetical protein